MFVAKNFEPNEGPGRVTPRCILRSLLEFSCYEETMSVMVNNLNGTQTMVTCTFITAMV